METLKRWHIVGLVAAAVLIVGTWPMGYLASPRWEVWVVSADGRPISQTNVRLVYKNYSAESESHEVTLRTDESGHVLFPQYYEKASIFQRVFHTMSSAMAGVHASFGRHAYVFAFGGGYEGSAVTGKYVTDWRGDPDTMQSRIVAKRSGS
jgi:hypothetical protein